MRLLLLVMVAGLMHVSAAARSQTITLSGAGLPMEKVLEAVRNQSGYEVTISRTLLDQARPVSIDALAMPLAEFLDRILAGQPLQAKIEDKTIILSRKEQPTQTSIRIIVSDADGVPLAGASVNNLARKTSSMTAANGVAEFPASVGDTVEVSFVGYVKKRVAITSASTEIRVSLHPTEQQLAEVEVSTGMFTRKRESFTGAVTTVTGAELRQIGNNNVVESLKTLDPAFVVVLDNLNGDNPNGMPQVQLRGQSSISTDETRDRFANDPNLPLVILNGMESNISRIVNLNMNQIESITLLKDASSTALFGSRAANGVLVVETVRPKPGDLRLAYTNDTRFQVPDLRSYNMMDAAENLEFQRIARYFGPASRTTALSSLTGDNLYYTNLAEVLRGVNTDWMSTTLQTSVSQSHNLQLEGGSDVFLYMLSGNYRHNSGMMKGSANDRWNGVVNLQYRKGRLNFTNDLLIQGEDGKESPYGSFSQYVNLNPFYRKYREDGSLNTDRYLAEYETGSGFYPHERSIKVFNPLYNAVLNSRDEFNTLTIQNNLRTIWDITDAWRLNVGFQIERSTSEQITFSPALHTDFEDVDITQKGRYSSANNQRWSYQGNAMLTYRQTIGLHVLNGNLRGEVIQKSNYGHGYTASGFPYDSPNNPAFSFSFLPNSRPIYTEQLARQVNAVGSVSYIYDNRFFVDGNYTIEGSTVFGSAKKFAPFWSIGGGWNLHRESLFANSDAVNLWRLRANIGSSGNQQLGNFLSSAVYSFLPGTTLFGSIMGLSEVGNPNLEWQRTRQTSLGMDLGMWNNRLTAQVNAFYKNTDPLVVAASTAASTGVATMPLNVGRLAVHGLEIYTNFSPIYRLEDQVSWQIGLNAVITRQRYHGFGESLRDANNRLGESGNDKSKTTEVARYLHRYYDGNSPNDIWAVRSRGIDPATGLEIYEKRNGDLTFVYDPDDVVVVGNSMPTVEGILSSRVNFKRIQLSVFLRYSLGSSRMNNALYNKVENITISSIVNNHDKRAFENRWLAPGDHAFLRAADVRGNNLFNPYAAPSSRFIQRENFLVGESISLGYDFLPHEWEWMKAVKVSTLRFNVMANNIFRLATVRAERGLDYPFANTMSFSVTAMF